MYMSTVDESPSPSDPDTARPDKSRSRPFLREEWRELNAAQLVCIAVGTVSAMFGLFGGVLVFLSAMVEWGPGALETIARPAVIPSVVALACSAGAVMFTRSADTRRAARQECGPAVLMALTGLLGVAVAWVIV